MGEKKKEKKNASVINSRCLQICKIKYFSDNAIAPVIFMGWYTYLKVWMCVNLLLGERIVYTVEKNFM